MPLRFGSRREHDAGRSGAGMGDAESPPAAAARAPAGSPARTSCCAQLDDGPPRRRVGLRRARSECRCAAALCCLPGVPRPTPSARSHPAASDLRSAARSPWVTCRARSRRPARRVFAEVRGSRVPVEVTDLPFVPHRYKRTNLRSNSIMLKFTADHEWLRIDGDVAVVGITRARSGAARRPGFCRAAGIRQKLRKRRAGRSGGIVQGRLRRLRADQRPRSSRPTNRSSQIPRLVNSDPLGNGWFFKLKIADPSEIDFAHGRKDLQGAARVKGISHAIESADAIVNGRD